MFVKTHVDTINIEGTETTVVRAFIRSTNIQAFPCGRRRASFVQDDVTKFIPFDPEARLNTEANNRKHSSLNGYKQTYLLDWDQKTFSLVLAGYLFNISHNYSDENAFAEGLLDAISAAQENNYDMSGVDKIYANIAIEDVLLASGQGFNNYYTSVLSKQGSTQAVNSTPVLDLLCENTSDTYYFSGLSFSVVPINTVETQRTIISLGFLKRNNNGNWQVDESAKLPKIDHGDDIDSVVVDKLAASAFELNSDGLSISSMNKSITVDSLNVSELGVTTLDANTIKQGGNPLPTVTLANKGNGIYQLQFTNVLSI